MHKYIKYILIIIAIVVVIYLGLGYISSYIGWYGYKKWKNRVGTTSIEESRKRGVFVKELHFKVDSFSGSIGDFRPYIERGFRYGRHTSEETVPLTDSDYPYQLSYNYKSSPKLGFLIRETELHKFDSSNRTHGFLKTPNLKDTIIIEIGGEGIHSGIIKVYQ